MEHAVLLPLLRLPLATADAQNRNFKATLTGFQGPGGKTRSQPSPGNND